MSVRDPALDHAGRFGSFLTRAIEELKPVDTKVTLLEPNRLSQSDDLVVGLTGAASLATALTARIAAAKAKFAASNTKVDAAFGKMDNVSVVLEKVAGKIEKEADDALAQIGQISNGAPE